MVSIFTGLGAGYARGSGAILGGGGLLGSGSFGRGGENVSVNGATGNLLISNQDEFLVGRGLDVGISRTYNSAAELSDRDNGDNWQQSTTRRVYGLTGTLNTVGSTISRQYGDGSAVVYTWNDIRKAYVTTDGDGAHDMLVKSGATWIWTDGSSQMTEVYEATVANPTTEFRIKEQKDTDGFKLSFTYVASTDKIYRITTANHGVANGSTGVAEQSYVEYVWSGDNVTEIVTGYTDYASPSTAADNVNRTLTRTRYAYDGQNRLITVTVDLTPDDNSVTDGSTFVTSYTYDSTSNRVASISTTGGATLSITYDGSNRVATLAQTVGGVTRTTTLTYGTNYTTVTGPDSQVTRLDYDSAKQLTKITSPTSEYVQFTYDANGNLTKVRDTAGKETLYGYGETFSTAVTGFTSSTSSLSDSNYNPGAANASPSTQPESGTGDAFGNLTKITDANGNVIERWYDIKNSLIRETRTYQDEAGATVTLTTRYAYDSENHLRYVVSPEGRVTEYRYTAYGEVQYVVAYPEQSYAIGTTVVSEADLNSWKAGFADLSSIEIVWNVYDGRGNIVSSNDHSIATTAGVQSQAEGFNRTYFVYDQAGRLLSRNLYNELSETFLYDGLGRLVGSTDLAGGSTTIVFNDAGLTTTVTTGTGYTSIQTYNVAGELVSGTHTGSNEVSGSSVTETTAYKYDKLGRVRMITTPLGVATPGDATDYNSFILYDNAGRKTADIAADGSVVEYRYDSAGRLAATIARATKLTSTQMANLAAQGGNVLLGAAVIGTGWPATSTADVWNWSIYDFGGRLIQSIDNAGEVVDYVYDKANRLIKTVAYATRITVTSFKTTLPTAAQTVTTTSEDRIARSFYDRDGMLVAVLDGEGYLSETIYDKAGRKVEDVAYAARTSSALWANGSLADLRTSAGPAATANRRTHYVYDGQGLLRYQVDNLGYVTGFEYGLQGRARHTTTIAFAAPISTSDYTFDNVDALITPLAVDANDRESYTVYNTRGQAMYTVDASGGVTAFTYDSAGRVIKTVQYATLRATSSLPALATMDTWAGAQPVGSAKINRSYYSAGGQLLFTVDAAGYRTKYIYDADGQLISSTLSANPVTVTDATTIAALDAMSAGVSITSTFAYDQLGRLLTSANAEDGVTAYEYNALGQVVKVTDPLGKATHQYYDGVGRLAAVRDAENYVTKTAYNAFGEVASVTRFANPTTDPVSTTTAPDAPADDTKDMVAYNYYDDLGRLTFTIDAEKGVTRFYYDGFGAVVQQVRYADTYNATAATKIADLVATGAFKDESVVPAPTAAVATSTYDGLGRLATQTDASGVTTTSAYTAMGELQSVTRGSAVTSFEYNKRGQVTKSTDAEGWFESYGYDAFGNRTSVVAKSKDTTKVAGGTTTYTYDKRGLLLTETLPIAAYRADGSVQASSITNSYSYDVHGNRTQTVEGVGLTEARTTTYEYDKLGRLKKTIGQVRTVLDQTNHTTTNASFVPEQIIVYDAAGNVTSVTDAAGGRSVYFYDDLGRKTVEIDAAGTYTRYAYDANGNVTSTRVYETKITTIPANGGSDTLTAANAPGTIFRETLFTYDRLGRLTKCSVTAANTTGYTLKTGNYSGSAWTSATTPIDLLYQYDVFGNVVKTTDANTNATWNYYDKLGRKTVQIDALNYRTDWTYDGEGNVLTETRYAAATATPSSTTTPPSVTANAALDRVTTFTYDKNGNRLSETRSGIFVHNGTGANEATAVDATIRWEYNGLSQVVRKYEATDDATTATDDNSHSTRYTYDVGGRLITEQRASFTSHQGVTVTPTVDYRYNALGDLSRSVAVGAGDAADRITTYTYGAGGLLATLTDAEGVVHTYAYDKNGTQIRDEYNRANSAGTVTLNAVLTKVDVLGRTIEQSVAWKNGSVWAKGDIATTEYNVYGEVAKTGLNGIWQQENKYDVAGRLWATNSGDGVWKIFGYDKNGNQTIAITNAGYSLTGKTFDQAFAQIADATNGVNVNATYTVYDKRNMATSAVEEQRQRSATVTDALTTTSRTYNAFGETLTETNARGGVTSYSYNKMGKVVRSEGPAVAITLENGKEIWVKPSQDFYYDRAGRLLAQRDANGSYAETGTNAGNATSKTADTGNLTRLTLLAGTGYGGAQALVLTETQADNGVKQIKYDVHGDARLVIDAEARETEQVFDKLGRLSILTHPGATGLRLVERYAYDSLGQRLRTWNNLVNPGNTTTGLTGEVQTTDYDIQGRVIATRAYGGDVTSTSYVWSPTIAAISGVITGGWTETTRMSDSAANLAASIYKQSVEKSDIFGRVTEKTDLGGHVTTYTYDVAGRQTSATLGSTVTSFTWFNTGQLATNSGLAGLATYGYDRLGNRASETLVLGGVTVKQMAADYDLTGRMTAWSSTGSGTLSAALASYRYDANGNIRATLSQYMAIDAYGTPSGTMTPKDYWFRYDSMNRVVTDKGTLSGTAGAVGTVIVRGSGGVDYEYNEAGERTLTRSTRPFWQMTWHSRPIAGEPDAGFYTWDQVDGVSQETFTYDAAGRLYQVFEAGVIRSDFAYDLMGRVTLQQDYGGLERAPGGLTYSRSVTYNAKGQVSSDDVATRRDRNEVYTPGASIVSDVFRNVTTYSYGSGSTYHFGSVLTATVKAYKNDIDAVSAGSGAPDTLTTTTYEWWDGAVQKTITHDFDTGASGTDYTTIMALNALGQLVGADVNDGVARDVTYKLDENGQIIRRDESRTSASTQAAPHEIFYRYAGKQMGMIGNNGTGETGYSESVIERSEYDTPPTSSNAGLFRDGTKTGSAFYADFAQSLTPYTSNSQGSSGGTYTVRAGDTLSSIAQMLYGDANLWYKLAEANGLSSGSALTEGQALNLPAGVTKNTHSADTFKPYDPTDAIGDLSPTTPKPPKKPKCAMLAMILVAVVAIAATVVTAGAALSATGLVSGGVFGATGGVATVMGGGLLAVPGLGLAGAVAIGAGAAAVGSVVSQAVGVAIGAQDKFNWKGVGLSALSGGITAGLGTSFGGDWAAAAARGAVTNVLTQGIGRVTGLQSKFDFAGVAAAAVGAGVSHAVSPTFGNSLPGRIASGTVAGIANAATRSAINGSNFGDNFRAAMPDIIGQAIGSALLNTATAKGPKVISDPVAGKTISVDPDEIVVTGQLRSAPSYIPFYDFADLGDSSGEPATARSASGVARVLTARARNMAFETSIATIGTSETVAVDGYYGTDGVFHAWGKTPRSDWIKVLGANPTVESVADFDGLVKQEGTDKFVDTIYMDLSDAGALTAIVGVFGALGALGSGGSSTAGLVTSNLLERYIDRNIFSFNGSDLTFGGDSGLIVGRSGVTLSGQQGIVLNDKLVSIAGENGLVITDQKISVGGSSGVVMTDKKISVGGNRGVVLTDNSISVGGYGVTGDGFVTPGAEQITNSSGGNIPTFDTSVFSPTVSYQSQLEHVKSSPKYTGKGYFQSVSDAQSVLDAVKSGDATFLGFTPRGNNPVFQFNSITGVNHNPGSGYSHQPTNIFFIKGTKSVTVVPYNPIFGQ